MEDIIQGSNEDGHSSAQVWSVKPRSAMTPVERMQYRDYIRRARRERDSARERLREEARIRTSTIWNNAIQAIDGHPYLQSRRIAASGARYHKGSLVIPVRDIGGNIHDLQLISGDGTKRFLSGTAVKGHFFAIGDPLNIIYISEGFATAATVHAATGQMVVATFTAANLVPVARQIREQYPGIEIVIVGDSDCLEYANRAAGAAKGLMVYPDFPEGVDGNSFNDLGCACSLEMVRKQIETPVEIKDQFETGGHSQLENREKWEIIRRLAELDVVSYESQRLEAAAKISVRATVLDGLVAEQRKKLKEEAAVGALEPSEAVPWRTPVDGAELLNELHDTLDRFAVLPQHVSVAIALWIIFTYLHDTAYVNPILCVASPTKRCGKTTVLSLLMKLVCNPLSTSNISGSALFRSVEKWSPTLIVDEADTFIRSSDELRGILNSGHTKDTAFVIRTSGEDHEPTRFSTWCCKAIALIGTLPDTLQDRSIVVWLQRKSKAQKVTKRRRHHDREFEVLRRKCTRWAMDNALAFESAPPIDVPRLHDRQSDNWEPLAQIARIAGGGWPEAALQAAAVLSGAAEKMADESIPIDLMSDIRHLFMTEDTDRLGSQHIADALAKLEGRPWPEFRGGKSITTNQVAHLLKPYQVRPHNVRIGEEILKGYLLGDFEDAFSRYLPPTDRYVATNIEKQ